MKSFCKSLALGLLVSIVSLLPVAQAHCQSAPEPAVVVSIAKFKEQMNDVNYLLTASGFAQMKFMASAMVKGYTKGLDSDKDAGVMLFLNEDSPEPDFLGFVPVTDMEEMLDVISQMAEVEEEDDFTTITTDQGVTMMIREHNGYAFISNKEEMFDSLPDAPGKMLGDLPSKYNLAAKVYAQRIPQSMRDQFTQMIKESSEQTLDSLDEDDELAELQRKNLEMSMKQMEMMITESDTLTIGMSADKDGKNLLMDLQFTGLPDSSLAKKLLNSKADQPSRFTGFLMDGAAFTQNQIANLDAEDAAEYAKQIDQLQKTIIKGIDEDGDLTDDEIETVDGALTKLMGALKDTLNEGLLDSGAVVMLEDGEINFAFGAQVSNPAKVEGAVKELVAMAEDKMGGQIEVNLNSGSHKAVTFHEVVVEIPDDEEEAREMLGDQVTIVVGIGKKEVYFAGGSNPVATLKKAMDGTAMAKEMMQYNFYVTPMLKFAASMEGDPAMEKMAAALEAAGKDRVSMTADLIENGINVRFEMQDGILSLIKVGFEAASGGGFAPSDDDF
ncbi:MAG: hypothetical protein AB8B55_03120 [Mariniblastus sp.]